MRSCHHHLHQQAIWMITRHDAPLQKAHSRRSTLALVGDFSKQTDALLLLLLTIEDIIQSNQKNPVVREKIQFPSRQLASFRRFWLRDLQTISTDNFGPQVIVEVLERCSAMPTTVRRGRWYTRVNYHFYRSWHKGQKHFSTGDHLCYKIRPVPTICSASFSPLYNPAGCVAPFFLMHFAEVATDRLINSDLYSLLCGNSLIQDFHRLTSCS